MSDEGGGEGGDEGGDEGGVVGGETEGLARGDRGVRLGTCRAREISISRGASCRNFTLVSHCSFVVHAISACGGYHAVVTQWLLHGGCMVAAPWLHGDAW